MAGWEVTSLFHLKCREWASEPACASNSSAILSASRVSIFVSSSGVCRSAACTSTCAQACPAPAHRRRAGLQHSHWQLRGASWGSRLVCVAPI